MKTAADSIQKITISDASDGSVSVTVEFDDGSEHFVNADLSPDFVAISERQPDGSMSYPDLVDPETGEHA